MHIQSQDPHATLKRVLIMSLFCWGLMTIALTDHPHPAQQIVVQP